MRPTLAFWRAKSLLPRERFLSIDHWAWRIVARLICKCILQGELLRLL